MNQKLRKLRIEKGLSQEYLANQLGISQKAYSKIETGQVTLRMDKVQKLSNILEIDLSILCIVPPESCPCHESHDKYLRLFNI